MEGRITLYSIQGLQELEYIKKRIKCEMKRANSKVTKAPAKWPNRKKPICSKGSRVVHHGLAQRVCPRPCQTVLSLNYMAAMSSQQLKTALTNVPPVTKALTAAIIVTSTLGLLVNYSKDPETESRNVPVLGLVPG
jgi:hypothetical protein